MAGLEPEATPTAPEDAAAALNAFRLSIETSAGTPLRAAMRSAAISPKRCKLSTNVEMTSFTARFTEDWTVEEKSKGLEDIIN